VPGSGKARHVDADLRHQDVRGEYEARSWRVSSCIMRLTRGCVRLRKPPKQSDERGAKRRNCSLRWWPFFNC
jgi:hypothetical protein